LALAGVDPGEAEAIAAGGLGTDDHDGQALNEAKSRGHTPYSVRKPLP